MPTFNELVKAKIDILEKSPEKFSSNVEKAQLQIWRDIEKQFDKLETKNGVVIQSSKNLALISEIVAALRTVTSQGDYFKSVEIFLGDFDKANKISVDLAKEIVPDVKPSEFATAVRTAYRENAVDQLFRNPLNNTASTLRNNLINSISQGSTLSDTVKSARDIVTGGPDTDGRMLANIKTVAATAIATSTRGYSAILNDEIGAEWFRYIGGEIDTTRPFCEQRNGLYFHKKEIEAWGNGQNAGGVGGINDEGKWDGMIAGTTSFSIFVNCGGWNCRHDLIAVSLFAVPQTVIDRNIANGNFNPKK